MQIILYSVILFVFLIKSGFTAYTDTLKKYFISEIKISGNEITEDFVILREMKIQAGNFASEDDIAFDRERIFSLGIFSNVVLFPYQIDTSYVLNIFVKESWYIWPLPVLDRRDKDWEKISYGIQLKVQNFRGRNETLEMSGALGFDPYLRLQYKVPNFIEKSDIQLITNLAYEKRLNKSLLSKVNSENYEESIITSNIMLGKRFGYFNYLNLIIGYLYLKVPLYYPGRTISTTGIDSRTSLSLNYIYDSRNFAPYPSAGSFISLMYSKIGLGESLVSYSYFGYDARFNYSLGDIILALRNSFQTNFWGEIPNYANTFLGYGERIRGKFFDVYEGQSMMVGNIELRYPFVKDWLIEFDFPIIPKRLQSYNVLIDFHLFADAGATWFNWETVKNKKLVKGFGFGFSVAVYPYNVGRLELAFDEKFKSQIILDLSTAF